MKSLPIVELMKIGRYKVCFTRRGDCVADMPYSGFNVCDYTGDDRMHVMQCREALAANFGLTSRELFMPRQTHSDNVAVISSLLPGINLENVDALVSNQHGIIIGVNTADCVPVALVDPVAGISGVAHAGWRGALSGIVEKTVKTMTGLGASAENIRAVIGPGICQDCFEVGYEVASLFPGDCVDYEHWSKPHVSLQRYIYNQLLNCGLSSSAILEETVSYCTRCHADELWSARKMGVNSGRLFTFVVS